MTTLTSSNVIELAVGALFVLFHAYKRFNDPVSSRSTTTAFRYHSAACSYVALSLILYFVLVKYLQVVNLVAGGDKNPISKLVGNLSAPLIAALVLTGLLPKLPGLRAIDDWVKRKFQAMGAIPFEVRRLSNELARTQFTVPSRASLRDRAQQRLQHCGLDLDGVSFTDGADVSDPPSQLWTKIVVVMAAIEDWKTSHRYASFVYDFQGDYDALQERFAQLEGYAKLRFGAGEGGQLAVCACVQGFREEARRFFGSVCDFVSRGVLQCNVTEKSRKSELESLGFTARERSTVTVNQMVGLFLGFYGIVLCGLFAIGTNIGNVRNTFLLVMLIAANYLIAVACAVFPRRHWGLARRNRRDG